MSHRHQAGRRLSARVPCVHLTDTCTQIPADRQHCSVHTHTHAHTMLPTLLGNQTSLVSSDADHLTVQDSSRRSQKSSSPKSNKNKDEKKNVRSRNQQRFLDNVCSNLLEKETTSIMQWRLDGGRVGGQGGRHPVVCKRPPDRDRGMSL